MTDRRTIGKLGEDAAAAWLERHGHRVLGRNWRGGRVELDIVSSDREGIHFVEVKTRTAPVMADPAVNVGAAKQKHLHGAALAWLHAHPGLPVLEMFFDIITVVLSGDGSIITLDYYPQAFIPTYV